MNHSFPSSLAKERDLLISKQQIFSEEALEQKIASVNKQNAA